MIYMLILVGIVVYACIPPCQLYRYVAQHSRRRCGKNASNPAYFLSVGTRYPDRRKSVFSSKTPKSRKSLAKQAFRADPKMRHEGCRSKSVRNRRGSASDAAKPPLFGAEKTT